MLLGAWRSFDHLEEELSMHELIEIVRALRDKEWRMHKMNAALKGINLDENKNKQEEDPVEAAKRRVAMRQSGLGEKEYEAKESEKRLESIGFKVNKV